METCQVELTLTLYRKVMNWSPEDQIYFSAFVQSLREMSVETVLAASNCIIDGANLTAADTIDELNFWMKLRMDWSHFVIRQPAENFLTLSDQ